MSQVIQGCHKCGKHPLHPTESMQSYKIFKCNQCQTLTCNQHLIGLAGNTCPNCSSSSLTCLATSNHHKQAGTAKSKDSKILPSKGSASPTETGRSKSISGFGAGSPLVQHKAHSGVISATLKPTESMSLLPKRSLAADFIESMAGGGLDKIKPQMVTASIEHHSEHEHRHIHEHTHTGNTTETQVAQNSDSKINMLSAADTIDEQPLTLSSPLGMTANISQNSSTTTIPASQESSFATPEELPDPASLRSGVTVYTDACFRPSFDDKLASLGKLLEQIDAQLTTGKNIKIVTLAIDFYDVSKSMPELVGFLQKYPFIRLAVGYGAKHATDDDLDFDGLQQFINTTPHVIALDTGLDLHFAAYSKTAQIKLLQKQIEIANHLGKPIYLSAVKADEALEEAIHQPIKGVYVSPLMSEAALAVCKKHNLWVCTRSEVTHQTHADYIKLLAKIPTGKILLGSGSQLIAPAGQKAMTNSPLYIDDTAKVLMQLYRYQKLETLYSQCYKNLYGLLMGL